MKRTRRRIQKNLMNTEMADSSVGTVLNGMPCTLPEREDAGTNKALHAAAEPYSAPIPDLLKESSDAWSSFLMALRRSLMSRLFLSENSIPIPR